MQNSFSPQKTGAGNKVRLHDEATANTIAENEIIF